MKITDLEIATTRSPRLPGWRDIASSHAPRPSDRPTSLLVGSAGFSNNRSDPLNSAGSAAGTAESATAKQYPPLSPAGHPPAIASTRYGLSRAMISLAVALAKGALRFVISARQQRRLQVGSGVTVAHDVSVIGKGEVILGDQVTVERNVVFCADTGAVIEIGAGSIIGANSLLMACAAQVLRLGRRFDLGEGTEIVSAHGVMWGDDGSLGDGCIVGANEEGGHGSLRVGDGCHFHRHSSIDLCADVLVGDNVQTGPYCALYTHNHVPRSGTLVWNQHSRFAPISIASGVWVGHNCCILPGTSIGAGSTIAAGTVIRRSVDAWRIVGEVPPRVLKMTRGQDNPRYPG